MKTNYGVKLQERNGWFQFLYTVPKGREFRFKGKKQVRISLGTKDREEAFEKRSALVKQYEARAWAEDNADLSSEAGKEAAANMNIPFLEAPEVKAMPVQTRVEFLSTIFDVMNRTDLNTTENAVIVGAIKPPALSIRKAFERFKELCPEKVKGKTPLDTKRFWRRYEKAVDDFVEAKGDINVLEITNDVAKSYRRIVKERLDKGEFKSDEANKKLDWLRIILNTVFYEDFDSRINPFQGLKKFTSYDDDAARPPFTPEEIQQVREQLEKSGMSAEAKAIIRIGACTGANARELALMEAADIHLKANIPFIQIRPNSLRTKVKKGGDRHRDIPLVGDALEAMREFPTGFPSFQNEQGPDNINGTASDFFKKVTPGKGFSSYRHNMKDWLRNSKCTDALNNSITGHKNKGLGDSDHYGLGYELEVKREAIENALKYAETKIDEIKQNMINNKQDMTEVK
ncbi:hypothetical protein NOI24_16230 [Neorhizobium galegae]|uniref:hypothetical protein n=1 Tax=Neorhizobium galegae TaxID=399 RepID=UPI0021073E72|nr:hypothetical protein [Neorhizobium galegae]MCQ1772858.1 hypothetical protein [Neorhizobium galegae]MCQ1799195.1 hypothetical protein [Neorhizobium galegae]